MSNQLAPPRDSISRDTLVGTGPPLALAALDTNSDGRADMLFVGYDRNRDGVPDALQGQGGTVEASPMGYARVSSSSPVELLSNQLFSQPSGSQSHVTPNLGVTQGTIAPIRALSPPRRGPSRNGNRRIHSTPRSGFSGFTSNADLTIAIPTSPSDSLDLSERYSESLARRIHDVAERWRSRFEETRHHLDTVELTENKRSWQDKMHIFELEEEVRVLRARAKVASLEQSIDAGKVRGYGNTATELIARSGTQGNEQAMFLEGRVADAAYLGQIAAPHTDIATRRASLSSRQSPQAMDAEHFELIEALQSEVRSLRATQQQLMELQARDHSQNEQIAALQAQVVPSLSSSSKAQAESERLRAVKENMDAQVKASLTQGPEALTIKERRSLAMNPDQRQQEVLMRALELKTDLSEEGEDCTKDEQILALMMRVAALEQELVEESAKGKQASATLCSQITYLQAEVAQARTLQEQSPRRSSVLEASIPNARQSIILQDSVLGRRSSILQESRPSAARRFSQSPAVVAATMEGITSEERQTLDITEGDRNQEILSRVANINEDLGEQRKIMHSNAAQQCQFLVVRVAELEQELKEEKAKSKQANVEAAIEINELAREVEVAAATGRMSLIDLQNAQIVSQQLSSSSPALATSNADAVRKSIAGLQISQVSHLESQLADAHSTSEKQNLMIADYRRRIAEVEQANKDAVESEVDLTKLISELRRRIAELERELADAHVAEASQVQKQNALNVRIVVLEQELSGTKALEDKQMETNSCLRRRVEELEQELADLNTKGDRRIRLVADQSARIAELERQLASGDERVAGFESKLAVAHSRDME